MTLNGDSPPRGWPGGGVLVVEEVEPVMPPMESDPWHVWLNCDLCGNPVSYERAYGLGESPTEFVAYTKAGLAEAYNTHLAETHNA